MTAQWYKAAGGLGLAIDDRPIGLISTDGKRHPVYRASRIDQERDQLVGWFRTLKEAKAALLKATGTQIAPLVM